MRVKIYLNPNRDLELVAIMYNPTLNFSNIAKEAVRSHVRGNSFSFQYIKSAEYCPRSLVSYISFDDEKDADIVEYFEHLVVPRAAFIRNIMVRSIGGNIGSVYTDERLRTVIGAWKFEKEQGRLRSKLKKKARQAQEKTVQAQDFGFQNKLSAYFKERE
ncbi:MAG: hypothetical protein HFH69_09860 [Lachnospiraceae bacterium]|nr:hypothetical protein [Lachnospiraceae bacterium]